MQYVGFGKRLLASMIDGVVLAVVWGLISPLWAGLAQGVEAITYSATFLTETLIAGIYYVLMESSPMQGTLGKKAVGIKVCALAGQGLSFGHAFARYLAKMLNFPFFFGFILMFFTKKKQTLHDLVSCSVVVTAASCPQTQMRYKPTPEPSEEMVRMQNPKPAPQPQTRLTKKDFTRGRNGDFT